MRLTYPVDVSHNVKAENNKLRHDLKTVIEWLAHGAAVTILNRSKADGSLYGRLPSFFTLRP